jgi:hypothetical protein
LYHGASPVDPTEKSIPLNVDKTIEKYLPKWDHPGGPQGARRIAIAALPLTQEGFYDPVLFYRFLIKQIQRGRPASDCVPRMLVAKIPSGSAIPFEEAACGTVGAICLHGIRTAGVSLGDTVAVMGLGLLGQITVQQLKAAGCRVLGMDLVRTRMLLAIESGADSACSSAAEFRDLCFQKTGGAGVDSVLITAETASSEPVNLAAEVARDRAVVVAVGTVGMNIERKLYYGKELDFRVSRSYGPGRYDTAYEQKGRDYPIGHVRWTETRNLEAFLQMIADGKLTPILGTVSMDLTTIDITSSPSLGVGDAVTLLGFLCRQPVHADVEGERHEDGEPEEGEQAVTALLATESSVRRAPVEASEVAGLGEIITANGDLRTLPCHLPHADPRLGGLDGFYAARLAKS